MPQNQAISAAEAAEPGEAAEVAAPRITEGEPDLARGRVFWCAVTALVISVLVYGCLMDATYDGLEQAYAEADVFEEILVSSALYPDRALKQDECKEEEPKYCRRELTPDEFLFVLHRLLPELREQYPTLKKTVKERAAARFLFDAYFGLDAAAAEPWRRDGDEEPYLTARRRGPTVDVLVGLVSALGDVESGDCGNADCRDQTTAIVAWSLANVPLQDPFRALHWSLGEKEADNAYWGVDAESECELPGPHWRLGAAGLVAAAKTIHTCRVALADLAGKPTAAGLTMFPPHSAGTGRLLNLLLDEFGALKDGLLVPRADLPPDQIAVVMAYLEQLVARLHASGSVKEAMQWVTVIRGPEQFLIILIAIFMALLLAARTAEFSLQKGYLRRLRHTLEELNAPNLKAGKRKSAGLAALVAFDAATASPSGWRYADLAPRFVRALLFMPYLVSSRFRDFPLGFWLLIAVVLLFLVWLGLSWSWLVIVPVVLVVLGVLATFTALFSPQRRAANGSGKTWWGRLVDALHDSLGGAPGRFRQIYRDWRAEHARQSIARDLGDSAVDDLRSAAESRTGDELSAASRRSLDRLFTTRSLIRWSARSLPAIGFFGTVRGIMLSLDGADDLVQQTTQAGMTEAMSGITASLALAFATTAMALGFGWVCGLWSDVLSDREDAFVTEAEQDMRNLIRPTQA